MASNDFCYFLMFVSYTYQLKTKDGLKSINGLKTKDYLKIYAFIDFATCRKAIKNYSIQLLTGTNSTQFNQNRLINGSHIDFTADSRRFIMIV